jgi:hypothetical protein
MKGLMSIIEVLITGMILFMAFLHFFPQYVIITKWDGILLHVKVMDTLNTMDRLSKTYEFATDSSQFENFMNSTFHPEKTGGVVVWWKSVDGLDVTNEPIPYFTRGYKESMVDVGIIPTECSVDPDTVGLWHFNIDEDPTLDETDNDNDGDVVGANWTSSGKFGGAFDFDGSDDYIEVPDGGIFGLDITEKITIEAWVKFDVIDGTQDSRDMIVGKSQAYIFAKDTNNKLYFNYHNGTDWAGAAYSQTVFTTSDIGKWFHVAATYSKTEGKVRIYINGQLDSETSVFANSINTNDNYIGIGKAMWWDTWLFGGTIDEVRISNVARSSFDMRYDVYSFTLGLGYPF